MHTEGSAANVLQQAASLLLYQNVLETEVGQAFLDLLEAIQSLEEKTTSNPLQCLRAYGQWFKQLASMNQSWQTYLVTAILHADNPFTQAAQGQPLSSLLPAIKAAAQHDLQILYTLSKCDSHQIQEWISAIVPLSASLIEWIGTEEASEPIYQSLTTADNWADVLESIAAHYRHHGVGLFAKYHALKWQAGQLVGIPTPDPITLTHLVGYQAQQEALIQNTEFLLQGFSALNVLLYGGRGTGKSSLVKGLLNRYGRLGLRLIEVPKSELNALPTISDQLRDLALKFIIFVDDLSFEEDEAAFKALKVVLEGSLTARPQNVVVYATSNRRHLIREFFGDRPRPQEGDEIHAWDTVQEKLSFSDRFGLTLTFEPTNQAAYLQIVHHLAQQRQLSIQLDELEFRALQWATRHNGRSGRSARQFVDFLQAELAQQEAD